MEDKTIVKEKDKEKQQEELVKKSEDAVETPKKPERKRVKHLVFSGGGVRGLAYIGCYKALVETCDLSGLESCSGCSIGSIMSMMIVTGYKPEELYDFILHFDYSYISNISYLKALTNYGIENGEKITQFLGAIIKRKTGSYDTTFAELYNKFKIKLTVNASCLNTYNPCYFNHETSPNMTVLSALRMSISIPLLLSPVIKDGQYFVDGAVLDNFPISSVPDSEDTVGFTLEIFPGNDRISYNIQGIDSFIFHVFGCIYNQLNQLKRRDIQKSKIIHVDVNDVSSISINTSVEQRLYLFNTGYDIAYKELKI